jgi:arylsulfatase I/J
MDALAAEGVVLNRHYVHMMCTPSRSSFMTGRLPVHVQLTLDNPEASTAGVPYNMTGLGLRMLEAGYRTSFVGKWDCGWATARHSPLGRGFEQSLVYAEHKVDYFNSTLLQSVCEAYNPIVDLWDNGAPATGLAGSDYEDFIFRDRVLDIIAAHDPAEPLFLVHTPHVAHCPLQVPPDWLARFGFVTNDEAECSVQTSYIFPASTPGDFRCRAQYHAMCRSSTRCWATSRARSRRAACGRKR